jgi:hypothetical protein
VQGMPCAYIVDLFLFIIRIIEKRLAPPLRSEQIIGLVLSSGIYTNGGFDFNFNDAQ